MKNSITKRIGEIISIVLILLMVIGLLPQMILTAKAAEEYNLDLYYGNISINSGNVTYYDSNGTEKTQAFLPDDTLVIAQTDSNNTTANSITINDGTAEYPVNITLSGVNINSSSCAIELRTGSNANLTLDDGTTNTLISGGIYAGIQVPSNTAISIYGNGTLNAEGGIGGDSGADGTDSSTASVPGGNGGDGGNGGTVTISGGIINVTGNIGGGSGGSGGGGYYSNGGNSGDGGDGEVTISGGTINVTGNIGGGMGGSGGDGTDNGGNSGDGGDGEVTISGGTINVTGNIGGGMGGSGGDGTDGTGSNGGNGGAGTVAINSGAIEVDGNIGGGTGGTGGSGFYDGNGGSGGTGTITISRGAIEVTGNVGGGSGGSGGSGGYCNDGNGGSGGYGTVTISGGTTDVTGNLGGGSGGSGGSDGSDGSDGYNGSSCEITGGSLSVDTLIPTPKSGSGTSVYLTTVTLHEVTVEASVFSIVTESYDYGTNDMVTDTDGKLYLWLPENTVTTGVQTAIGKYTGTVTTTTDTMTSLGTLTKFTDAEKPTVSAVTPSGVGAPLNGDIEILFSEPMDTSTAGAVNLNGGAATLTGGTWSNYNRNYTISFSTELCGTEFTVSISGFTDTFGNEMDEDDTHSFTTVSEPELSIKTQPADISVAQNEEAQLEVIAVGTGTLTYQWYSNTVDLNSGGSEITGATQSTYTAPTDAFGTTYYYCEVSLDGEAVSETSEAAAVTAGIKITSGPTLSETDDNVTVSITAQGNGTLSYQWYKNTTDSNSGGAEINGATESTYTLPADDSGSTYYYYCVVTDESISVSTASNTKSVSVIKDTSADLKSLTSSTGTLSPGFDADTVVYSIDEGSSDIKSIGITAKTEDDDAELSINGDDGAVSGTEYTVSLTDGTNLIPVVVTSHDGKTQKSYIISVNGTVSDADLSSLSVKGHLLNETFSPGATVYTLDVGNSTGLIELTAETSDSGALMIVNGEIISNGNSTDISLLEGENSIEIMIVAQNASTKTYTLTVTREEPLTITTYSLPIGIIGIDYSTTLTASGGSGSFKWNVTGLPEGFKFSEGGTISGTPTSEVEYKKVLLIVTDSNDNTDTKTLTLTIKKGCGNGAYVVESDVDSAYSDSYTNDGFLNLTVNSTVSGFTYFRVNIFAVTGHVGEEVCLFVHTRNGVQLNISATMADFDTVSSSSAAFNVRAGDVIKVYIVDELTNDTSSNPDLL